MPECLEIAYIEQMPVIRAEQTVNAAQVAMYPKMNPSYAKKWMESLMKQINRTFYSMGITFNGKEINADVLKRRLKTILGSGLS